MKWSIRFGPSEPLYTPRRQDASNPGGRQLPPPPPRCDGFLYTVQPTDTLFSLARRFGLTVAGMLAANPQIQDPDRIFAGQVICIPVSVPGVPVVRSLEFLDEDRRPLPVVDGFVRLAPVTIVRVTVDRPVSHAFFFLTPTGTDVFEFTSLIGVRAPDAPAAVLELRWEVPPATLGFVFVVVCDGTLCRESEEVAVVREEGAAGAAAGAHAGPNGAGGQG